MFVFFSKLLAPLVYPLGLAATLWAAAAVLAWCGRARWARRSLIAGIAVVLLFSNAAIGEALLGSLEEEYPPAPVDSYPVVDAIVVLGGMTAPPLPPRLEIEVGDGIDRLFHGMRLLRAGKAEAIVLTGGVISYLVGSDMTEAQRLAIRAREYGVPEDQLVLEERSLNTHENAVDTAAILKDRGWQRVLLVTSASHMRRSVGVFRNEGVEVVPAPTDFQVVDKPFALRRLLPDAEALRASTKAIKEYVGLSVYWLRGWLA